ncbi:MAG: hypothetical protein RLZZ20_862 [Pseudomonadota bacterium]|jgi:hypothetical protein
MLATTDPSLPQESPAALMATSSSDSSSEATDFIIQGVTSKGKAFRPSDWADRLCGIMSRFHPDAGSGYDRHLQYSPYVQPALIEGVRAVRVDARLHALEPMAYHFMRSFAKDNDLTVIEACVLPDRPR